MEIVYYATFKRKPLGRVLVAVGPRGVVAVRLGGPVRALAVELRRRFEARLVRDPAQAEVAVGQVREYLRGQRQTFEVALNLNGLTAFQQRVLRAAQKVPYGETITYAELAQQIGQPQAARAVGQALGRNPIALMIPCHRVLAADQSLRGYSGGQGISTKAWLLALEGVLLA